MILCFLVAHVSFLPLYEIDSSVADVHNMILFLYIQFDGIGNVVEVGVCGECHQRVHYFGGLRRRFKPRRRRFRDILGESEGGCDGG